jgi:long-chain acyl-CoA synthetase
MDLSRAFCSSVEKHRAKPACFWGDAQFTYGDLLSQTHAVKQHLQGTLGIKPGDRVGMWLKNCPEFIPALFGVLAAGGVVVPINNFLKPDEVSFILSDAGVDVLIAQESSAEAVGALKTARPALQILNAEQITAWKSGGAESFEPVRRQESDLAVIVYTSGTTGRPKGAMLSHGNLLHNVESCRQVLAAVDHDRFVVLLPMFHSFMLTVGLLLPLIVGGSIVLIRSLHPPKNVFQEIIQHQATILPAIPQFFRALVDAQIPVPLPLRLCVSGAAPLPVQILKEFNAKFPIPLLEGYGLSEASPVVSMNPIKGPWKAGSIGIPVPDVEVSIQNDTGEILNNGDVGEICVRGGNVMQGYWNQAAETATAFRSGWLLTGDVGYRDADGYYFITDRKKDMLLVNGINVYPREIEEVIYQFPGIKEAAVVGVPDPRRGEQPVAFVAGAEGVLVDERTLLQFVRAKLADYKVPRRIQVMTALPRNATGKILKTVLREQAHKESA